MLKRKVKQRAKFRPSAELKKMFSEVIEESTITILREVQKSPKLDPPHRILGYGIVAGFIAAFLWWLVIQILPAKSGMEQQSNAKIEKAADVR